MLYGCNEFSSNQPRLVSTRPLVAPTGQAGAQNQQIAMGRTKIKYPTLKTRLAMAYASNPSTKEAEAAGL